jgi:type IV pilus assembly protein PilB
MADSVWAIRQKKMISWRSKETYYPPPETLRRYFLDDGLTEVPFYRGRGCPKCRGTGDKGRIAYHELVLITEEIRSMISEGRSAQEITRTAAKAGCRPPAHRFCRPPAMSRLPRTCRDAG